MGLLFTKRTPCNENEHLYAIEKEFDSRSVTLARVCKWLLITKRTPCSEKGHVLSQKGELFRSVT